MPCSDGRERDDSWLHERADAAARAACEALSLLQTTELFAGLSGETRQWWERHQAADAARKAEEARVQREKDAKRSAMSKLTPEELRVLGLIR